MLFARTLLLVAVATAVVMSLMAPSAVAINQIEVTKADGATHCPTLATGGCAVHAEGEITLFFHIFGFEGAETKCHVEYRSTTDEDGSGQITAQEVTPGKHDADCSNATRPPCAGSLPWNSAAEKDADGVVRAHYDVCTDPAESGTCSGEFITVVTESGTTAEAQTQTATDLRIGSSFCELTVSQTSEVQDPLENPPSNDEDTHIKTI